TPTGRESGVAMKGRRKFATAAVLVGFLALAGWASSSTLRESDEGKDAVASARIAVEVHRAPGCGCCGGWEAYLSDNDYEVSAADDPDIVAFKVSNGVPLAAQSCHTALIEGYVVEGHVPVAAIEDLLRERPDVDGIALPGMPAGSPGMPGVQQAPFEVVAFAEGEVFAFGSY
ncbi:MAG: DUF411 domain-containing protein, partial [Chloroflexota bacterium]